MLFELLTNSEDYVFALKRYSSGIILGICYGLSLDEAEAQLPNVLQNNDSMGSDVSFFGLLPVVSLIRCSFNPEPELQSKLIAWQRKGIYVLKYSELVGLPSGLDIAMESRSSTKAC